MTTLLFYGLIGLGLYLIGFGGLTLVSHRRAVSRLEPVRLSVIGLAEELGPEDIMQWAAVYRVLDGSHAGREGKSPVAQERALHQVGDEVEGWFDPVNQSLRSREDQQHLKWMPIWMVSFGCAAILVAVLFFRG